MKKLIAALLTLVMLVGMLPTAFAVTSPTVSTANSTLAELAGEDGVLKILSIGNKFSRDCMHYLKRILHAEGVKDVKLGYLFNQGITLATHWSNIQADKADYYFYENDHDSWFYDGTKVTMKEVIAAEDWDVITLHETKYEVGQAGSYADGTMDGVLDYVHANKTNPKCKIGWNMTWSRQEGLVNADFEKFYGSDQTRMYEAIVSMVKTYVEPRSDVDFIIPAGTAIQNARSSFMGETMHLEYNMLNKDGVHLSDVGRLIAAYTWYAALSNTTLTELKFTNCFPHKLTSAERKVIVESINNAIKTPFAQTKATYTAEPAQYTVTVDGSNSKWMPGDTVPITAVAAETRKFKEWKVVSGGVELANSKSADTTFVMPARDVELKAEYHSTDTGNAPVTGLEVGFSRMEVKSNEPQPLAGYSDHAGRATTAVLSEEDGITVTANVITDGETATILYTEDYLYIKTPWLDAIRPEVSAATGVPEENITIAATHTHAAPAVWDAPSGPYFDIWRQAHIDAAVEAMADLSPVSEVKVSSIQVPNMNFIRHWRAQNGFMLSVNVSTGPNGAPSGGDAGTTEAADDVMRIIRFVRPGDEKKDVVMINYQGHATVSSTSMRDFGPRHRKEMSADYPGYLRRDLEARDGDCHVSVFVGASGNINMTPVPNLEAYIYEPIEEVDLLGQHLADYALEAMKDMKTVEVGPVECISQDHMAIYEDYTTTYAMEQTAVAIGKSIVFATAPYEMFDINAKDVRAASPYEMTFILSEAGGDARYVAAWETFAAYPIIGSAVTYESQVGSRHVAPGSAEDLADGMIGLIKKLYRD